jgi:hypothetical protein
VAAVSEHTARAWREGSWWVVDLEGVGATQARTLDKVDHMARALIADVLDEPYESVRVTVAIDLPDDISGRIAAMNSAVERSAQLGREAAELQADLVARLAGQALTGREIAVILKVTPGRVSQIKSGSASGGQARPEADGEERQTA